MFCITWLCFLVIGGCSVTAIAVACCALPLIYLAGGIIEIDHKTTRLQAESAVIVRERIALANMRSVGLYDRARDLELRRRSDALDRDRYDWK